MNVLVADHPAEHPSLAFISPRAESQLLTSLRIWIHPHLHVLTSTVLTCPQFLEQSPPICQHRLLHSLFPLTICFVFFLSHRRAKLLLSFRAALPGCTLQQRVLWSFSLQACAASTQPSWPHWTLCLSTGLPLLGA